MCVWLRPHSSDLSEEPYNPSLTKKDRAREKAGAVMSKPRINLTLRWRSHSWWNKPTFCFGPVSGCNLLLLAIYLSQTKEDLFLLQAIFRVEDLERGRTLFCCSHNRKIERKKRMVGVEEILLLMNKEVASIEERNPTSKCMSKA